jgi:hypothetical protein
LIHLSLDKSQPFFELIRGLAVHIDIAFGRRDVASLGWGWTTWRGGRRTFYSNSSSGSLKGDCSHRLRGLFQIGLGLR